MDATRRLVQLLFYLLVSAVILSRAVSAGINHDENQFIAPGQLLVEQRLLPYRDYPYTHMPYAIPFYALAASVSRFDYLAARLLGVMTWLGCIGVLLMIFRLIGGGLARPAPDRLSWICLLGEFALISIFVNHPLSILLQDFALNHMLATLFSLMAFLMFMRGSIGAMGLPASAFCSGLFVCIAGFVRFNYASLVPVMCLMWCLYAILFMRLHRLRLLGAFGGGVALAALPAAILAAMAPAPFYYGNIVYIRLNTLYYEGLHWPEQMDLLSKVAAFIDSVLHGPANIIIYGAAITAVVFVVIRLAKRVFSIEDLNAAGAAAFAGTLFLTAFAPTPSQLQYFFAPIPFLIVLVALVAWRLRGRSALAYSMASLVILAVAFTSTSSSNPSRELSALLRPDTWPPLQIHAFAERISSQQHVPAGAVLAILPMIPSEAGYASYPFTATGPFSWRTSLLLTAERRAQYGVISPEELAPLLDSHPPVAILTGLEPPKAGFAFRDAGGLERPFAEYAAGHGYSPVTLYAGFLQRFVTLWVRPRHP